VQKAPLCLLCLLTLTLSFLANPAASRAGHGAQAAGKQVDVVVQQAADGKDLPLTVAEKSNYKATSRFQEVVDFCNQLTKISSLIRQTTLGTTTEGRKLPMLVIADPPVATPEEARKSGKLVIYLQGNIHAGEVDAKEAVLMIAREIATQPHPALLKDLILLVVPIFNADGNERFSRTNRPGQLGPEEGMGVRTNAQGFDLNRDFVKLESPEVRALVRCINQWDPAVVIDGHTTDGSFHRYVITYEGPRCLAGDADIIKYTRDVLFPEVGKKLEKATGFHSFFYGNFSRNKEGWETVPGTPRYGIHYVGLHNRIGILSESYSYASYKDRIIGGREFFRAIFEYCAEHKKEILAMLEKARADTVQAGKDLKPADKVAVRQKSLPMAKQTKLEGYEDGPSRRQRGEKPKDYLLYYYGLEEPVISVRRPGVYLIKPGFDKAIDALQRHGVEVEVLREDVNLDAEAYKVAKINRQERAFQGHRIVGLDVTSTTGDRKIPAGTFVVKTAQPLGDLAVYLLEPQCEDGLAAWNFFDAGLEEGSEYPVLRVNTTPALLTTKARALPEERSAIKPITYDMLYGGGTPPNLSGSPTTITKFLDDGEHFVQYKGGRAYKVQATTGKAEPMPIGAQSAEPRPAIGRRGPARVEESLEHKDGDLYLLKKDGSAPQRLTKSPGKKKELYSLSPGGKYVAFVHANNLYTVDVATQTERALTNDGSATISNGKADWVYFEEIFNRDWRAYWWSGDGDHLAFLHFDDKNVKKFTVVNHIPVLQDVETTPYPKAGDPNPVVTVNVATLASGKVRPIDTASYPAAETLYPRAGFLPDGKTVYFYVQDRTQTWLDLCTAPIDGGPVQKLLRNTTQAYVEDPGEPRFLNDGSFLLTSEKTGYRHFYHHASDGKLINAVTSGPWEVRSLVHVDEDKGLLYFMGMQDDPIGANLYRVKLDGKDLQRLTLSPGEHRIVFSPKANYFVDFHSNPTTPVQARLYRTNGALVRTLDTNPVYATEEYKLGTYEMVQIPTSDGFQIEGSVLLPPDFDARRKYPVWFMTYAGPHAPTMRNAWVADQLRDQLLANLGIVVFKCDPRSASGKGAIYTFSAYRQLGIQELKDIETAIKWLCQRPYIDANRIGMSGHSYGGFMTAFAMTHSKLFAAGISGAPVTDWHNYDTIYTERYMSTPQLNSEGYAKTSVVSAARDLHGKLLILHGIMDDNVHVQNTVQFVDELQKANKPFEMMFYPRSRHGIFGQHYNRIVIDFIQRSLGVGPDGKNS
jgi:dipeptidyl aminopeptidase/acylaminoacyl peptidase